MLAGKTGQGTLLLRGALAALDSGDPLPDGMPADLRARIAAQLGVLGSVCWLTGRRSPTARRP